MMTIYILLSIIALTFTVTGIRSIVKEEWKMAACRLMIAVATLWILAFLLVHKLLP